MSVSCLICKNSLDDAIKFIVKEMMMGTKEEFEYLQCSNCQVLQIKSLPTDMLQYYEDYYTEKKDFIKISQTKKLLWGMRRYLVLQLNLYPLIKYFSYNTILHWAYISRLNIDSKILDVGCGNGDVLYEFSKHGFRNLYGIDPYLKVKQSSNLQLEKSDLLSYNPSMKYDLIMFNHSFEHIHTHHENLKRALMLLDTDGTIMIRTPIINKAFEIYKKNWVQIDAPRHFIIHSLKSMRLLCEMNDAEIFNYFYDSTAFQFLGSEQFKKGISSYASNSYKINLAESIFTEIDISNYEAKAKEFNRLGLGDQAAFFIRKKK